ncbi:MAG: hypothetical protein IBX55_13035 [Methyloprofundus sp.]|nr:hypothetical protein [Methyloprofundus sp.]
MTRKEALQTVETFQKWRVGDIEGSMDDLFIKPRLLTQALDIVLSIALEKIKEDQAHAN